MTLVFACEVTTVSVPHAPMELISGVRRRVIPIDAYASFPKLHLAPIKLVIDILALSMCNVFHLYRKLEPEGPDAHKTNMVCISRDIGSDRYGSYRSMLYLYF